MDAVDGLVSRDLPEHALPMSLRESSTASVATAGGQVGSLSWRSTMDDKKKKLELDKESIANLTGTGGGAGRSGKLPDKTDRCDAPSGLPPSTVSVGPLSAQLSAQTKDR